MNTFFLQASPNAGIMQLVLLGGMIVVFYFFMIRPQAQKAKKAKKFQDDSLFCERLYRNNRFAAVEERPS